MHCILLLCISEKDVMEYLQNIQDGLRNMHWAEIAAVFSGIIYVVLAAQERIACWIFGIINGIFSVYLFWQSGLLAESFLYIYYILAGFYGWYTWIFGKGGRERHDRTVMEWSIGLHLIVILTGFILSWGLAWFLRVYTDAQMALVDAHTTIFSFIATFMVTRKVMSNWLYWIVIDTVSIWLYSSRSLYLYALLMVGYTVLAIWGYRQWRKQNRDVLLVKDLLG
ncbi:MAG: nicotinamide mononucleotide transporter [Saprospiraceae bacterium]|nr:nicotinamide mononucleotide transporter [Saprospiraceae bacterium]